MMSLMLPLHSLGQGNQIEKQHDVYGYVVSLASYDTNSIAIGTWH